MKKFATLSAVFLLSIFFLLSCAQVKTYDDGFEDGYDEGYFDAKIEFEDHYIRGFDDGYSEGYWVGSDDHENRIEDAIEEAEHHAREYSGYSPMEALDIIGAYHDPQNPLYAEFNITEEEYLQAVDALYYFYEYLRSEY